MKKLLGIVVLDLLIIVIGYYGTTGALQEHGEIN
tara:strand:- start:26 stop:127 length:102 start_codon:yes stop_codon:yes gene_type:complete